MPIREDVWNDLIDLEPGTLKNRGPLETRWGAEATLELLDAGHLVAEGGRVGRTKASVDAEALWAVIPEDGSTIGNQRAREQLGWKSERRYDTSKALLLATGEIAVGRGRGGSVRRISDQRGEPGGSAPTPALAQGSPAARAGKPRATKPVKDSKTLEQRLWEAADALRGNQEPSEYKHVVLGLVFLKYISDRFEARRRELEAELVADGMPENRIGEFLEARDEYTAENVFWVPEDARWESIQARAKLPTIGTDIDTAMDLIEKENPVIRGVLPRNYGREGLDKGRLGQLVDLIGSIGFTETDDHGSDDVLGRVYEYFLGQFAGKETGKDAGAFYTPRSVVKTLVEMLEPFEGRVYDPACGSGGMFVQSAEFVKAHGGSTDKISVYGQEYTDATWRLAKMNLALRGIEADLGERSADTFTADLHPDLRADFILANPPFNVSNWWDAKLADDPRWTYGTPPAGNANFAWVQHFIHHLSPKGTAGFVLANGSLSSKSGGEGEIRRKLVEADLVDCIVAMPDRLFFNTGIPVSLWFVSKERRGNGHRDRHGEVLFIDARKLGRMETRRLRVLANEDVARIADAYHAWRNHDGPYEDVPGFSMAADLDEIKAHGFVLTPGRYVGAEAAAVDEELIVDKITRLTEELYAEFDRGSQLEVEVRRRLDGLNRRLDGRI
ncbi:type I restriction-modification system subunit M [Nocardioides houyundeii]|uniref:class I SAM-dependent DNA methyltransferase n=1 Tax=Nocardioides houyundeii TaxID=2045452 RepID=UPI0018EFFCC7|nr:class I SAM-dependent DNA methyltransferase [Nocardioides houyundeii]